MRVITGSARGIRLITPEGTDVVRPTSEKAKEGVFSSIQFDIEGRRVLDLFAGSGQLGIEALSRGAESAVFVDMSDKSLQAVTKNLQNTSLLGKAKVIKSQYSLFLSRCTDKFDIAFLDPPYKAGLLSDALTLVSKVMSDYGLIICEHPSDAELPSEVGSFCVYKTLKYGKIIIDFYKGANDIE